jgi:copper chaperone
LRTELHSNPAFLHPINPRIIKLNGENRMAEFTLRIDGMHCGSCVRRVTQALNSTEGVQVEEVRIGAARLKSEDSQPVDAAIAALGKAGYSAHLEH